MEQAFVPQNTSQLLSLVVPCYNEALRLRSEEFVTLAHAERNLFFCLVNDGSTDDTAAIIQRAISQAPESIFSLNLKVNHGKAEAVRVTYDPRVVRYDQLLQVFFSVVTDPTQLNRQGPDSGTQYRNALFPRTAEQRAVGAAYIAQLKRAGTWRAPIVTRLEGGGFYPAESYHQDFAAKNPSYPYIVRWDAPKVAALKRFFPGLYQAAFKRG